MYMQLEIVQQFIIQSQKKMYIQLLQQQPNKLGRLIGENLTGANKEFIGTLGSAGIKVLELEAARTGITEQEAKD